MLAVLLEQGLCGYVDLCVCLGFSTRTGVRIVFFAYTLTLAQIEGVLEIFGLSLSFCIGCVWFV